MTRFSNLEFEEKREKPGLEETVGGTAPDLRDEHFYMRQADVAYRIARFEQALRYYSRALEFDPNLEQAWVGQARMLVELFEFREAGLWAEKALEIFRDQAELLAIRALVHTRLGDRIKALEFCDAAAKQKNISPYVWLARGEVMLATASRNGDYCLHQAKALAGRDWFTLLLIARVYYYYRKFSKGLDFARQAMDLQSANPFVWYVIGNCQFALGLHKEARQSYAEVESLDRDFPDLKATLRAFEDRSLMGRLWSGVRGLLPW